MDKKGERFFVYLKEKGTGTWLAATNNLYSILLLVVEFRDELRGRYGLDVEISRHMVKDAIQNFDYPCFGL